MTRGGSMTNGYVWAIILWPITLFVALLDAIANPRTRR